MAARTWIGSLLPAGTVLLGIAAYFMYQSGVPGAPTLQQGIRFRIGPETPSDTARIRVLSPTDTTIATDARFILRGRAISAGEVELRLVAVSSDSHPYLVLQLGGGAVSTGLDVADDLPTQKESARVLRVVDSPSTFLIPEYRKFYDLQLAIVRMNPEAMFQRTDGRYVGRTTLRIQMRDPAIARENARYVVATPTVLRPSLCRQLDDISRDEETNTVDSDFLEKGGCGDAPADSPTRQSVTLAIPPEYFRIDYASPGLDDPGLLSWVEDGDIRVRASLVSIDGEAIGQQLLFFSGIAIGLASGLLPLAVEFMVSRQRQE